MVGYGQDYDSLRFRHTQEPGNKATALCDEDASD